MRVAKIPQPIPATAQGSPWMTPQQSADYLGIGVEAIHAACVAGVLKHARFGRSTIRIRMDWIEAWAEHLAKRD